MGEGGAEFVAGEEMIGAARAVGKGALIFGEGFVEQKAAGGQGALDGGKGGAVEIVEAENEIEGGFGQGGGFQIRLDENEAGERMAASRPCRDKFRRLYERGAALDGDLARGGQSGGAVERGGREIHGHDGPTSLGEPYGVLPRAAGEIERAGTGMRSREQGERFDEECRWFGRWVRGGFAVTGFPMLERRIHGRRTPAPQGGRDRGDRIRVVRFAEN